MRGKGEFLFEYAFVDLFVIETVVGRNADDEFVEESAETVVV